MSKFIMVDGGMTVNTEEILAILPQKDTQTENFNVIALSKNGITLVLQTNINSLENAGVLVDRITAKIDQTYGVKIPFSNLTKIAPPTKQESQPLEMDEEEDDVE